jgi:transposase-like protein
MRSEMPPICITNGKIATESLVRLYFEENLSAKNIGDRFGINPASVTRRLHKAGYHLRPPGGQPVQSLVANETLKQLYFHEKLSLKQVGARTGIGYFTVRSRLIKAGYKLRPRKKGQLERWAVPIKTAIKLYCEEKLTLAQCATELNVSAETVRDILLKAGCPLRPRGSQPMALPADEIVRLYKDDGAFDGAGRTKIRRRPHDHRDAVNQSRM